MQIALLALIVALTASPALAHPGGLAADGCHYCRTNCETWGEVAGERHCHGQKAPFASDQATVSPPAPGNAGSHPTNPY